MKERFFSNQLIEQFGDFEIRADEFIDAGDWVVAIGTVSGARGLERPGVLAALRPPARDARRQGGSGVRRGRSAGLAVACQPLRIWLVGFGTVGRWLVRVLDSQADRLAAQYGVGVTVVGLANARDGFVHDRDGLDLPSVLRLASRGRSIAELPGVHRWPSALEGFAPRRQTSLSRLRLARPRTASPACTHARGARPGDSGRYLKQVARGLARRGAREPGAPPRGCVSR